MVSKNIWYAAVNVCLRQLTRSIHNDFMFLKILRLKCVGLKIPISYLNPISKKICASSDLVPTYVWLEISGGLMVVPPWWTVEVNLKKKRFINVA
jgi:hypothetical protein